MQSKKPLAGLALRRAVLEDALCLSVLAMQVFLDTYAKQSIRPALAREVLGSYSESLFTGPSPIPIHACWSPSTKAT